jgi:hypothetical protein
VVSTAMSINSPSTTPAAAARAGDRSQRDWSARPAAPPGRRDARGLTFSVVIPARVMQPKTSERGKQSWRLALCCYGMTLALHHRVQRCVSHRLRNSAVRPGSGDPWPDSVLLEGEGRVGAQASPQLQIGPFSAGGGPLECLSPYHQQTSQRKDSHALPSPLPSR